MTIDEAKIFIQNAMEQSRNALAELMLIMPKVFAVKRKSLGEYYSNLENCKKEIQACEVAVKALEEVQQYRVIGTVEECRAAMEKQVAMKPLMGTNMMTKKKYKVCPKCGENLIDTDYQYFYCDMCGQKLDRSDEE